MATRSMIRELARRRAWREAFEAAVRRRSADPDHEPRWALYRYLYDEGYAPEQAVTRYLQAYHLGEREEGR